VTYEGVTDQEALDAFQLCCRVEGIIPALESAHAIAGIVRKAREMNDDQIVILNLSGRGDKDIFTVAEVMGETL
jgi:tryptophan synthase beta chain